MADEDDRRPRILEYAGLSATGFPSGPLGCLVSLGVMLAAAMFLAGMVWIFALVVRLFNGVG